MLFTMFFCVLEEVGWLDTANLTWFIPIINYIQDNLDDLEKLSKE